MVHLIQKNAILIVEGTATVRVVNVFVLMDGLGLDVKINYVILDAMNTENVLTELVFASKAGMESTALLVSINF